MPRLQLGRQQAKRRDHRQIDPIHYRDKFRLCRIVHARNGFVIARIKLNDVGVFKNDLWLVIAHLVNLVRDLFMLLTANDNAHKFIAADWHAFALQLLRRAPLIGERIE